MVKSTGYMEKRRHPDEVLGAEEAGYRAAEEVWLEAVDREKKAGRRDLASKILDQQFLRDEDSNIYVIIGGERMNLGHLSQGYRILEELINRV